MKAKFRRTFLLVLPAALIAATLMSGGCDKDAATETEATDTAAAADAAPSAAAGKGSVAVVNLDKVAQELGLASQFTQIVNSQQRQLQDQLNNVLQSMQSNFDKQRQEFGEEPTDEQQRQLAQLQAVANQRINNMRAEALQQTGQLQKSLADQVRAMLKGPVQKIAKQRGLSLVLVDQNNAFYTAEGVDITDSVIEIAREDGVSKLSTEAISSDGSTKPPVTDPTLPNLTQPEATPESTDPTNDELFDN
ncbi:MAG: OmpH family outer membrane protein [Pirellulales bacterium]